MNQVIAYGAGQGSTALVLENLHQIRRGDLEVIFIDHGADLPETHQFIQQIQQHEDIDITVRDAGSLYDYCIKNKVVPSIRWRWCTDKFKIRPMKQYIENDIPLMGLTYDEKWRVKDFDIKGHSVFPLVSGEVTRYQAIKKIEQSEFTVPCKSGCYFCPFQSKEQWRRLYFNHLDLFQKAVALEQNAMERNPNMTLYPNSSLARLGMEFLEQALLSKFFGEGI